MARPTPRYLTVHHQGTGVGFPVRPQHDRGPETVWIDGRRGRITAGPRDRTISAIDAPTKRPYWTPTRDSGHRPPYRGRRSRPARPGPRGHYDHLRPGDPGFPAATVYGGVRLTLTVWEHYLGRRIAWRFAGRRFPRLEVIARIHLDRNAFSRDGYMEFGWADLAARTGPWCENLDVVAHEVGHAIFRSVVGHPAHPRAVEQRALEEAVADLVAIVTALHFASVVRRLLERSQGYLFSPNTLSRLAELGRRTSIRQAFNLDALDDLGWVGDPDAFKYVLARPFLGACYDILVNCYEAGLVRRRAIPARLAADSFNTLQRGGRALARRFARAYRARPAAFEAALLSARDTLGFLLARTLQKTGVHDLYGQVVRHMVEADRELYRGRHRDLILWDFWMRDLEPPR